MAEEPQKEIKNSVIINKNRINFDMLKISSLINKNGSYKEDNYLFEFYKGYQPQNLEEEDDLPKYLVDIKSEECRYLGVLSNILRKELYGYSLFNNGDEYFGQWNKDRKEGFGIYYFKESEKDEVNVKHIYIGEFRNNIKYGQGLYFKIKKFEDINKEEEKEKEILNNINKPIDFTFAIGKFEKDNFMEGIIYNLEGDKRQIYKGKMNEKGEKTDENAEIYENNKQIFNGAIKNNIMIKGIILKNYGIQGKNKRERKFSIYERFRL